MLVKNRIRFPLKTYFNHNDKCITAIDYTFKFGLKLADIRKENQTQALRDSLKETIGANFTPQTLTSIYCFDPEDRFGRKITLTALLSKNNIEININHVNPILKAVNRKGTITGIKPYGYCFYSLTTHRAGYTLLDNSLPDWITENLSAEPLKGKFIDILPK